MSHATKRMGRRAEEARYISAGKATICHCDRSPDYEAPIYLSKPTIVVLSILY